MRLLHLVVLIYIIQCIHMQCYTNPSNNCGGSDLSAQATPSRPAFKWRRRALNRRVKRSISSIHDGSDTCPMDFIRRALDDGMMGDPQKSMQKIYSFLTYMDREDLGIVCSFSDFFFTSYSQGYCFHKNNSTGESCLVFEI